MRKLSSEEVLWRQRTQTGRLTPMEVGRIKWHLADGKLSPRELASIYNVSLWTIRAIRRGDIWAWVEPNGPDDEVSQNTEMTDEMKRSFEKLVEQGLAQPLPPANPQDADETYKRLVAQGLAPPAIKDDRAAEVLERLEQTAEKDSSIQADKALEELIVPDRAKKFLE
jgi:hypothetical protein